MDINTLRTLVTLASFAVFIGILCWAYSPKRSEDFSQAAQLPFEQD
jgi:cytochrome c oxidase cbb3-type subunit 4